MDPHARIGSGGGADLFFKSAAFFEISDFLLTLAC
jgi:hypothetical protein